MCRDCYKMDYVKDQFANHGTEGLFRPYVEKRVEQCSKEESKKFDPFKGHAVHARLSPSDVTALSAAYPEYKCNFLHDSGEDHGFYHESRNLESKILLNSYLRSYVSATQVDGAKFTLIDVGGNHAWHARNGEADVHCCSPSKRHNADGRDIARKTERDMMIKCFINGNTTDRERERARKYLTTDYVCGNLVQECHVQALAQMSVHAVTEFYEELPSILYQHGSVVHMGTFMAAWDSIVARRGIITSNSYSDNTVVHWFRKTDADGERIHFMFEKDKSIGYSHDWRVYKKLLTQNIIVHNNHVALFEIIRQNLGIAFFKCTYLGRTDEMKVPMRITSRVFLPGFNDKVLVKGYLLDDCDRLVKHSVVAPRAFVEKINSYCTRIVNKEFSITAVLHVAFAVDSTLIVNGSVQLQKSGLSTEDIMFVVTCCYVRMFDVKWKHGMVVKKLLDDIKEAREQLPSFWKRAKRICRVLIGSDIPTHDANDLELASHTANTNIESLTFMQRLLHAIQSRSPDRAIVISDHFHLINMEEMLNVHLYGENLEEDKQRLVVKLSTDKSLVQTMVDNNLKSIYGETTRAPELTVPETSVVDPVISMSCVKMTTDAFDGKELQGKRLVNVPGDGNCGFHALSLGLKSYGIDVKASDIRFTLLAALNNYGGDKDSMRVLLMTAPVDGVIPKSGWCSNEVFELAASVYNVSINLYNKPAALMMRYVVDGDRKIYIHYDNAHFQYYEPVISAGYAVQVDVVHTVSTVVDGNRHHTVDDRRPLSLEQKLRKMLYTNFGIHAPMKSKISACSGHHEWDDFSDDDVVRIFKEKYLQETLCKHYLQRYSELVNIVACSYTCSFYGKDKVSCSCQLMLRKTRGNGFHHYLRPLGDVSAALLDALAKPYSVGRLPPIRGAFQKPAPCEVTIPGKVAPAGKVVPEKDSVVTVIINDGVRNLAEVVLGDAQVSILKLENAILKLQLREGRCESMNATTQTDVNTSDHGVQTDIPDFGTRVDISCQTDVCEDRDSPVDALSSQTSDDESLCSYDELPIAYSAGDIRSDSEDDECPDAQIVVEQLSPTVVGVDFSRDSLADFEESLVNCDISCKTDAVANIPDDDFMQIRRRHTGEHVNTNRSAAKLRDIVNKFSLDYSKMMDLSAAPGGVARDFQPTTKYYYPGGLSLLANVTAEPLDLLDMNAVMTQISQHHGYTLVYGDAATDNPTSNVEINKTLLSNSACFAVCLNRGGSIVLKSFCLPQYNDVVRTMMESFEYVHMYRPIVSNYCTSEFYIVATGFAKPFVALTGGPEVVDRYSNELTSVLTEFQSLKSAPLVTEGFDDAYRSVVDTRVLEHYRMIPDDIIDQIVGNRMRPHSASSKASAELKEMVSEFKLNTSNMLDVSAAPGGVTRDFGPAHSFYYPGGIPLMAGIISKPLDLLDSASVETVKSRLSNITLVYGDAIVEDSLNHLDYNKRLMEISASLRTVLKRGGALVLKSLCVVDYNTILSVLRTEFSSVDCYRTRICDFASPEFYIVARGYKGMTDRVTGMIEVLTDYMQDIGDLVDDAKSVSSLQVCKSAPETCCYPDILSWVTNISQLTEESYYDPRSLYFKIDNNMSNRILRVTTEPSKDIEKIPNFGALLMKYSNVDDLEYIHNNMCETHVYNDGKSLHVLGIGVRAYVLHDEINFTTLRRIRAGSDTLTSGHVKSYSNALPAILEEISGGYKDLVTNKYGNGKDISVNFTATGFDLTGYFGYCGSGSWDSAFPEVLAIRIPQTAVVTCNVVFDTVVYEQFQDTTSDLLTAVHLAENCVKKNMLYIFEVSSNDFIASAIKRFCTLFGRVELVPLLSESAASGRCMIIMSRKGEKTDDKSIVASLTDFARVAKILREVYEMFEVHNLHVEGFCAGGNQVYTFADGSKLVFDNYYITIPTILSAIPRGQLHYLLADLARLRNGAYIKSFTQNSSDMMKLINVFASTRNSLDTTAVTKYTVTPVAVSGNTVIYSPVKNGRAATKVIKFVSKRYSFIQHEGRNGYFLVDGLFVMLRTDGTLMAIDQTGGMYAPYVREHLNLHENVTIHVDAFNMVGIIDKVPGNVRYYNCPKEEYQHRQHEVLGLHANPMVPVHHSRYNEYYKRIDEVRSIERATVKRITEQSTTLWQNVVEQNNYMHYVPPKNVKNLWIWDNSCVNDPYVGITANKDVVFSDKYMCARDSEGIVSVGMIVDQTRFGTALNVMINGNKCPAGPYLPRGKYLFWDEMSVFTAREKCSAYDRVLSDLNPEFSEANPYLNALVGADIARIEGVAGCGKTTWILNAHNPDTDLVLTQTCAARDDVRERMERKMPGKPKSWYASRYRTVDSYLMNPGGNIYKNVYIDEGMKAHAGATLTVIGLSRALKARVIGDSMQLPYYCREEGFIAIFGSHDFIPIEKYLTITYRCPKDTARLLDRYYEKRGGMQSVSDVDNTFSLTQLHSVANIPMDDDALYLTTTQDEKQGVIKVLKRQKCTASVRTTDEAQGNESKRVIYVRYNPNQSISTYADIHQLIVTVTRHKQSFVYAKCVPFACPMAKFIAPVLTGGYVYGQTELLRQQGHYNPGQYQTLVEQNGFTEYSTTGVERMYEPEYFVKNKGVETVETMPVETIQFVLDQIFPGVYAYPIEMMGTLNAEAEHNLVLPKCTLQLDKMVALEKRRGQDAYVPSLPKEVVCEPTLKTILQQDRPKTAIETILALIKRNADVPDNACDMNEPKLAQYVVNKFFDSFVDPRHIGIMADFFENKIDLSSNDIQMWADRTNRVIIDAGEDNTSLLELNMTLSSKYKFQIKPQVKPKCAVASHLEVQALQTITFHKPEYTQIFSPLFRKYNDRVTSVMQSNVRIFSDEAPNKIADKINLHRRYPNENLIPTEVDFGKFDKSQGSLVLEIEIELLRRFGVNDDILKIWRYCHTHKTLLSAEAGLCVPIIHQRNSGDALTLIGNTTVAMCLLASSINLAQTDVYSTNAERLWGSINTKTVVSTKLDYFLAVGDDSYFVSDQKYSPEGVAFLTDVMNFETKVFTKRFGYFCSRFIIECDDLLYLVPDPMKMFVKLGRNSMRDPGHVEEYRRSLYDLTSCLSYTHVRELTAFAVAERYETEVNTISAICALHSVIRDPERFQTLYSFTNDNFGVHRSNSCFLSEGLTFRHRMFALKNGIPIVKSPTKELFVYSSLPNPEYICLLTNNLYVLSHASRELAFNFTRHKE